MFAAADREAARDIVTLPCDDRPKPAGKSNTSSRHRAGVTSRAVCGYRLGIGGSAVPSAPLLGLRAFNLGGALRTCMFVAVAGGSKDSQDHRITGLHWLLQNNI